MKTSKGWLYRPKFPGAWQKRQLYSLAQWTNGMAFRDIHFSDRGRPVIKIAEIKEGLTNQTKFTEAEYDAAYLIKQGDMLFAWSGQPETSLDVYWWRGPEGWLNQHIFKVEPIAQCDRTFFFYLLRYLKPNFIGIARNKQTTGLGHVTKRDLEAIEVALPPLSEQRAIAHILGTLDDKIELNRKMNQTLEALAQTEFKRMIRKGGKSVPLPEVIHVNPLRTLRKGQIAPYLDMANMPTSSARALVVYDREYTSGMRFINGDTLVARITPCLENGKVCFVDFLGDNQVGWGSTEYIVFRPKPPVPAEFAYFLARTEDFRAFAISSMTGTSGRQRVPADCFVHFEVVLPGSEYLASFGRFARDVFAKMKANDGESRTLAALRDALLPKLISGEIRVRDAERFLKERGL